MGAGKYATYYMLRFTCNLDVKNRHKMKKNYYILIPILELFCTDFVISDYIYM